MRGNLQELFSGRSTVGMNRTRTRVSAPESPKPCNTSLTLPGISRSRITIPTLPIIGLRASSLRSSASRGFSSRCRESEERGNGFRPMTPTMGNMQNVALPLASRPRSTGSFVGVDPEEQHLAELARSRRRKHGRPSLCQRLEERLFKRIKSPAMRRKTSCCLISGVLFVVMLAIYLILTLTHNVSEEFHILLILVILAATIFFCYSMISICMLAVMKDRQNAIENYHRPNMGELRCDHRGYAEPQRPIRIALARDEEAVGVVSEATKFPPPAYGLWRESVVSSGYLQFRRRLLTQYSESIRIASSGSATRQRDWNGKRLQPAEGQPMMSERPE